MPYLSSKLFCNFDQENYTILLIKSVETFYKWEIKLNSFNLSSFPVHGTCHSAVKVPVTCRPEFSFSCNLILCRNGVARGAGASHSLPL